MGQCLKVKTSDESKSLEEKTSEEDLHICSDVGQSLLPENSLYFIDIDYEVLLEVLHFVQRRQLVALRLVNKKFYWVCQSTSLKALHIISSMEIPAIKRNRLTCTLPKNEEGKANKYRQMAESNVLEEYVGLCYKGYPTFSVFDRPPDQFIRFAYVSKSMHQYEDDTGIDKGLLPWLLDHKIFFTDCTVLFFFICSDYSNKYLNSYMEVFEKCAKIDLTWHTHTRPKTLIDYFTTNTYFLKCNTIELVYDLDKNHINCTSLLEWLHWPGSTRQLIILENYINNAVILFLQKIRERFEYSVDQHHFTVTLASGSLLKKETYCLYNPEVRQQLLFSEFSEVQNELDKFSYKNMSRSHYCYRLERCSV